MKRLRDLMTKHVVAVKRSLVPRFGRKGSAHSPLGTPAQQGSPATWCPAEGSPP